MFITVPNEREVELELFFIDSDNIAFYPKES